MKINKALALTAFVAFVLNLSCATKGLVSEKYDQSFYQVKKLLPDTKFNIDRSFLVISDNQAGFRGYHVFMDKHRWTSPWMLAVPFYQLYLLGTGVVGTINYARHKPDYGIKSRLLVRDAIYEAAKSIDAAFILNIGDITAHDGRRPEHWGTFLNEYNTDHPIFKEIPFLPVPGNHDCANDTLYGYPNYQAIFDYPRFYTVEFPNAVIIILDSNFIIDQKNYIDDDYQDELFRKWFVSDDTGDPSWLEMQLEKNSKKNFRIVAMHHPLFSFVYHHKDWLSPKNGNDLQGKRKELVELFKKGNVQLVISGHDHLYQHTVMKNSGDDIHFIVGGGGGGPLRDPASPKQVDRYMAEFAGEGYDLELLKQESMLHYLQVDFNWQTLSIDTYGVTGDDDFPVRLIDNIVLYSKYRPRGSRERHND